MHRRGGTDYQREDFRWGLIMIFVAIGTADPLVQRFWEGCYRIGWWTRRRADRTRGALVDGVTEVGNLYVHVAEAIALRYKRWRGNGTGRS